MAVLSRAHLEISMAGLITMDYELTKPPRHGWVDVLGPTGSLARSNTTTFSVAELGQQRVRYTHDGSESRTDVLSFIVVSVREEDFLVSLLEMVFIIKALSPNVGNKRSFEFVMERMRDFQVRIQKY